MSFCGYLQANTAVDVLIGPFLDETDRKTAEVELTLSQADIKLSKNGQALTQKNDDTTAAHDANGYYNCELDGTDTNTEGMLTLIVHEAGALPVRHDFMVLAQAAHISLVTAKDTGFMDVNAKTVTDAAITAAAIADAAIDNATFAADVGSTSYATNIIALAVRKVLDELNLDHLCKTTTAAADMTAEVSDGTIVSRMLSKTSDTSTYAVGTDSLEAIRDAMTAADPTGHSATANTEVTGTLDGGGFADTATNDGSAYYKTGPAGALDGNGFGLDCNLTFNIGTGRAPSTVIVDGRFSSGASRVVHVWAYNYFTATYVRLSNSATDFGKAESDSQYTYAMTTEMVKVSDGEVKIRFTSTSITETDVWNCDYVRVNSVAQEAAGLTANAIQQAVWARADSGHDEETLGYNVSKIHLFNGKIVSATSATQFIIDAGVAVNDAYNGMVITLEDKTDDHYESRRIVDYIGATKEIFVDRAFGFTPVANDDYYMMNGHYTDVNVISVTPTVHTENADALLNRDMSAVSDTTARSPLNALRFLRNKWTLNETTLSVKKEDDTAEAWAATVTTSSSVQAVTGSDPD